MDVALACWQIGVDGRQLGLLSEEGHIVDHGKGRQKKKKNIVTWESKNMYSNGHAIQAVTGR